jgi:hypothetical protein
VETNASAFSRSGSIVVGDQSFVIVQSARIQPLVGTYTALICQPGTVTAAGSGLLTLKTTTRATWSGKLQFGGRTYSGSGKFDPAGHTQVTIKRPGMTALTLDMQLRPEDPDLVLGSVSDGATSAILSGARAAATGGGKSPFAGKYTLAIPGQPEPAAAPNGDGYGIVSVAGNGKLKIAGALADGTKFTQSVALDKAGAWPLYLQLYGRKGVALGMMGFAAGQSGPISGTVGWAKPPQPGSRYYGAGFNTTADVVSSVYSAPTRGGSIIPLTDGELQLSGGELHTTIRQAVRLEANNVITDTQGKKLGITFTTGNGLTRGRITETSTNRTISFSGVVLQNQSRSAGFFLGSATSGQVYLGPSR